MNNIYFLLNLGLITIPFFFLPGMDTRAPKMALALAFALTLSLVGIYQGKLKPFKNKWLLILMGFLLVNIWLCPKPKEMFGAFWVWQPLSYCLIFFMMLVTISSIEFNDKQKSTLFKVISWVGLVMAAYCILQFFGIDQFYSPSLAFTPNSIGGTLGNPTIVSPFIAMIIPIALYLKKYWFAGAMLIAVLVTKSQVAIGAMIASLIFLYILRDKKTAIRVGILSLIFLSLFVTAYFKNPKFKSFIRDSNRFEHWQQIVKDVNLPIAPELKIKYPFTGLGIGSYKYIYPAKHKNIFDHAHNEYLEILYNTGIIGLVLFLMSLWTMLKGKIDKERKFLLTSFVCIAICAGGVFCWQMAPHLFYTIVILSLLNNQGVKNGIKI